MMRVKDQEVDSGDFRAKSLHYIYMYARAPGTRSVLLTLPCDRTVQYYLSIP